jgi:hypothetical protein
VSDPAHPSRPAAVAPAAPRSTARRVSNESVPLRLLRPLVQSHGAWAAASSRARIVARAASAREARSLGGGACAAPSQADHGGGPAAERASSRECTVMPPFVAGTPGGAACEPTRWRMRPAAGACLLRASAWIARRIGSVSGGARAGAGMSAKRNGTSSDRRGAVDPMVFLLVGTTRSSSWRVTS